MRRRSWLSAALSAVLCVAVIVVCGAQSTAEFTWDLPTGFPVPAVPADNPMSVAKVELGRHLFYDLRMSGNGQQSCATCHQQEKAFTDGLTTSAGSTGEDHPRNSMSLVNVAYAATLTWGNPTMTRLEDQALVPMFGRHPIELGLGEDREWLDPLRREPRDVALFERAFPGEADGYNARQRRQSPRHVSGYEIVPPACPTIATISSETIRRCLPRQSAAKCCFTVGLSPFHLSRRLQFFRRDGRSGSESAGGEFHNTGL